MNRFRKLFAQNEFPLIVSLPGHSVDWALAAQDNGADAVKVHTSVEHPASGVKFGSLDQEAANFEKMRKVLNIPMGIVPGVGVDLEEKEINQMAGLGFDFFDAFISQITPLILTEKRLAPMLCILPDHSVAEAAAASSLPGVVCMEADIVRHEGYGKRMSVEDLIRYKLLTEALKAPLVVPSQRNLRPEEIPLLAEVGVGAVMIGAIVTGMTVEGVAKATQTFRKAIDSL